VRVDRDEVVADVDEPELIAIAGLVFDRNEVAVVQMLLFDGDVVVVDAADRAGKVGRDLTASCGLKCFRKTLRTTGSVQHRKL
jgi:hypothetical protein